MPLCPIRPKRERLQTPGARKSPILRADVPKNTLSEAFALTAGAASLMLLGNPGNMGLCGACFSRDTAGALSLFSGGLKIFRPEAVGVILGALLLALARQRFEARSGSHAATRLTTGVLKAFGSLVFLGCPFRTLQRIGGGDLNATVALIGFVPGVALGLLFETRAYRVGKTSVVSPTVGLLGPLAFCRRARVAPGRRCVDRSGPGRDVGPAARAVAHGVVDCRRGRCGAHRPPAPVGA